MKCTFLNCENTGKPEDGYDFFACQDCLRKTVELADKMALDKQREEKCRKYPLSENGKALINLYMSCSEESTWPIADDLALKADAARMFSFAGAEVKLTMELDVDTGAVKIVKVDDRKVED